MTAFHGTDARAALIAFYAAAPAAHPELAEITARTDWLAAVISGTELLYARRAALSPAGAELLADLAQFIAAHRFYGRGERALALNVVAARILGGGAAEEPGDPALDPEFAPPTTP